MTAEHPAAAPVTNTTTARLATNRTGAVLATNTATLVSTTHEDPPMIRRQIIHEDGTVEHLLVPQS